MKSNVESLVDLPVNESGDLMNAHHVMIADPRAPLDLAKRTDCKNATTDLITSCDDDGRRHCVLKDLETITECICNLHVMIHEASCIDDLNERLHAGMSIDTPGNGWHLTYHPEGLESPCHNDEDAKAANGRITLPGSTRD